MKKSILVAVSVFSFALMAQCTKTENIINVWSDEDYTAETYEYVITNYGAVGDGQTDCSEAINRLIGELPVSGGVIVIPEGDFVLDSPILVNRSFVTIKGVNPGLRSNVDVQVDELLGPGGGSKLILRDAQYGIHVPPIEPVNGNTNRISGVEIKDLLVSGGTSNNGTGIYVQQDNDGCRISNVIAINLNYGIYVTAADAMIIKDCWVSEVRNGIVMMNGIQNMITSCQLGAQPGGITVRLVYEENFVFNGNHVYPDGNSNLSVENSNYVNITGNNFQAYYVGMLEMTGNNNLVNGNIFWLKTNRNQLRGEGADYGVIRVAGDNNQISTNTVKCDWASSNNNPVTVRSISGQNNLYNSILITDKGSNRVFYVNETTRILDCVPAANVAVDGNTANVTVRYE